jgi:hypothetical protein
VQCTYIIFIIADIGLNGSASDIGSINLDVESVETSPLMSRVSHICYITLLHSVIKG